MSNLVEPVSKSIVIELVLCAQSVNAECTTGSVENLRDMNAKSVDTDSRSERTQSFIIVMPLSESGSLNEPLNEY